LPNYKPLWSGPENRHLVVDADNVTLHVLKLEPTAPAPTFPLDAEQAKLLRPLDWASMARIVGPTNVDKAVDKLVEACWPQITQAALIFINSPDQWPARTSFHAQAAARGTSFAPVQPDTASSPLDALGVGGWVTQRLSAEIRAKGKFSNIEDVAARVREASKDHIRRSIIQVITSELTGAPKAAMFFGRREGKLLFRTNAPAKAPVVDEEDARDAADPWKRKKYS
jgi:hypothetical protein